METKQQQKVVLEPSTNSHEINGDITVIAKTDQLGGIVLKVEGQGIVLHGEHGTIVTDSENVIKLVQQELNPVTKLLQNSFD